MTLSTKTIWPFLACCLLMPVAKCQPLGQTQSASASPSPPQATQPQTPQPQTPAPKTQPEIPAWKTQPYDSALSFYHTWLTPETHLFRGSEYVAYTQLLKSGYPYFGENSRRRGTVYYDGVLYKNVFLYYDLVTGQLVMNDTYNVFKIALFNELVDSFSIEDHFFIHLRDSLNPTAPHNGYYEQLFNGHILLLKKEKKEILEDLNQGEHAIHYIEGADSSYYLKIGNTYHPVNNRRSLSNTLKNRKKDLKRFLRSQHLSMRKEREITLIKVAAWYDSLPH